MTTLDDRPARVGRLDMDALDEAAKLGPLFLSDCEGSLQIWRESAIERIVKDETGEIIGYSTPGCYKATDLVAEWDLDTWDEGDDVTDDTRRKAARALVTAINSLPAQLEAGANLGKMIDMLAETMRSAIRASRAEGAEAGMAVIFDFADEMSELLEGLDDSQAGGDR